jgi:hypothetical protein
MSIRTSSTALPAEGWEPAAVARLALMILVGAALLNLIESIILAIKVRVVTKMVYSFVQSSQSKKLK